MRDPERIDPMIEQLREVWKAHPDLRLGQLVVVAAGTGPDPFSTEDDVTLEGLRRMLPG